MASRNFDGKVALLFREGRGLSAPWRHLADSGHTAGQQSTWAEREEEAEWAVRNWALGRDSGKHYVSQRRWRLGRGAGSRSEQTGSEAPLGTRFPRVHRFRRLRAHLGRGRSGAPWAAANGGLDFPGSRRVSLRRASTREPPSELAEAAAQASGSRWSSPLSSISAPLAVVAAAPGPTDMAAVLQQVLERTELNKLPKSVQNKLEKFLADQQSEIDGLKGRHEKFKVESGKCGAFPAVASGPHSGAGLVPCTLALRALHHGFASPAPWHPRPSPPPPVPV